MHTALTIAGSDSSGGAGIQADIKTLTAHGIYAMSAVTALTAQNTTGVYDILEVTPDFLAKQLDCVFSDIFPDAVKVGMTASGALIEVIADKLTRYQAGNIVIDPVMISTSGSRLLPENDVHQLKKRLLPLADLITPNIPEAEALSGIAIQNAGDMITAARRLQDSFGCSILIKGGHLTEKSIPQANEDIPAENTSNDLLCENGSVHWFSGKRIDNPNTHGTGCTLSSAIAGNLAAGLSLYDSVAQAKQYLSGALEAMLDLGAGPGPLNHAYRIPTPIQR